MNIENDPRVIDVMRKAELDIKELTGCEIHIAFDGFDIKAKNKDLLKNLICEYYDERWERIVSKRRPREISDAMFVYSYIARNVLKCTLRDIADECGNRNHATIINAIKKVNNYISTKDSVANDMKVIKAKFIKKRMSL